MKDVVQIFEDLIRRMLAPATAFIFLLAVVHLADAAIRTDLSAYDRWQCWLTAFKTLSETKSVVLLGTGLLVGLTGCSYVLSLIHYAVFDAHLRKSFAPWGRHDPLAEPRQGVRARMIAQNRPWVLRYVGEALEETAKKWSPPAPGEETSWAQLDYMLYEVVGGIDHGSTVSFVNDAKAYGVITLSGALALISLIILNISNPIYWGIGLTGAFLFGYLGYWLVRSQYRARALRLYVNLLMMPHNKIVGILSDYKFKDKAKAESEKEPKK